MRIHVRELRESSLHVKRQQNQIILPCSTSCALTVGDGSEGFGEQLRGPDCCDGGGGKAAVKQLLCFSAALNTCLLAASFSPSMQ